MTNLKLKLNILAAIIMLALISNVSIAQLNIQDSSDNNGVSVKTQNNNSVSGIEFLDSSNKFLAKFSAAEGGAGCAFKAGTDLTTDIQFFNKSDNFLGALRFRRYSADNYQSGMLDANGRFFLRHTTGSGTSFMSTNANGGAKINMSVLNDGRVSIGRGITTFKKGDTTTPFAASEFKLFVETGILTEKVKVAGLNTSDWADYVFEEDYEMLPIDELEDYVKENKHLPNVPSAQEVADNGLDLAKTDATLLEKIEESHLYIIELNNKLSALQAELETVKISNK